MTRAAVDPPATVECLSGAIGGLLVVGLLVVGLLVILLVILVVILFWWSFCFGGQLLAARTASSSVLIL